MPSPKRPTKAKAKRPTKAAKAKRPTSAKAKAAKARKRPTKAAQQPDPSVRQIRTSERSTFQACRWQWSKSYQERLTPIVDSPPLRFGTLIHEALELRYPPGIKRGPKPAETFEKLFQAELEEAEANWGFRDADGTWADACELGVDMLENYVATYGRDEEWKVVASEMTFSVPVMTPAHPDGQGGYQNLHGKRVDEPEVLFHYVGTMDGVWESRLDGTIWVNDYKTTKGNPVSEAQGKAILDEQATAYWTWGVDYLIEQGILKPRQQEQLAGMLYTFLRKAKRDPRPVNDKGQCLNADGTVSKKQPTPLLHRDVVYRDREQIDRARDRAAFQAIEMQLVEDGKLQAYKVPGTGFPNQQCKGCAFFDICELDEIGADPSQLQLATMKTWDPYAAHEIREEGKRG